MISSNKIFALFFIVYFLIHLLFINNYPLNFEFTFSRFANYFIDYDYNIINQYFLSQANTLVYPFISGLLTNILQIENPLHMTRIISLTSYLFLFYGLRNFLNFYGVKLNLILILLFFLNPLIFNFGFRGTPDLISSALGFYGISKLWDLKFNFNNFVHSIILSFSIILKPHCIFFLIVLCIYYIFNKKKVFDIFLINLILVTFLVLLYFLMNHYFFDFYIYSKNYSNALVFKFSNLFNNLILYYGFLFLFILPFSILNLKKKINLNIIFTLLLLFLIGSNFIKLDGEMNLGPLNKIIGNKNLTGLILIFVFIGLLELKSFIQFNQNKDAKKLIYPVLLGVVIFLVLLAFFRPVQRYLLVILPMIYVAYFIHIKNFKLDNLSMITIFFLILINLTLTFNAYINSNLSSQISSYLVEKKIENTTNLGPVNAHINYIISDPHKKKEYYISLLPSKKVFKKKFKFDFFGINIKKFYLNKY